LCAPAVQFRTARELAERIAPLLGPGEGDMDEMLLDLGVSIREAIEEAHCSGSIAGPEELFREEVLQAVRDVFRDQDTNIEEHVRALARLYAGKDLDAPTDLLPLSPPDRAAFHSIYDRYLELRDNPLLPSRKPAAALEQAFQNL